MISRFSSAGDQALAVVGVVEFSRTILFDAVDQRRPIGRSRPDQVGERQKRARDVGCAASGDRCSSFQKRLILRATMIPRSAVRPVRISRI